MEQSERTRNLLIMHGHSYPKLEIQDIIKFLYQSAFGCQHMISSLEAATEYIVKEYDEICHEGANTVEPLDGGYSRVPLSCLDYGLCADTLAKLLIASSKQEKNGLTDLVQKLKITKALVIDGFLSFRQNEFEKCNSGLGSKRLSSNPPLGYL